MYISIDGKIDGPGASNISSAYYSDELFRLSNADGNGRKTIAMYAAPGKVDLSKYSADGSSTKIGFQILNQKHGQFHLTAREPVAGKKITLNIMVTKCMQLKF